jgi:hypothetical protein
MDGDAGFKMNAPYGGLLVNAGDGYGSPGAGNRHYFFTPDSAGYTETSYGEDGDAVVNTVQFATTEDIPTIGLATDAEVNALFA